MRVAVIGHGRMGREVEAALLERGHEPVIVARAAGFPPLCPVGIDFTQSDAVAANARRALETGARYVVGTRAGATTSPNPELSQRDPRRLVYRQLLRSWGQPLLSGREHAAELIAPLPRLRPLLVEAHRNKKYAPWARRRSLAGYVRRPRGRPPQARKPAHRGAWHWEGPVQRVLLRAAGGIIGEHTVGFDSAATRSSRAPGPRAGGASPSARARRGVIESRTGFFRFEEVVADLGER